MSANTVAPSSSITVIGTLLASMSLSLSASTNGSFMVTTPFSPYS